MSDKFLLEKDIERRLVREIKKRGGRCLKWVSPGAAGVPDRIVLMPYGNMYFVELKRPQGGERAALQSYWERELTRLGYRHVWLNTQEQLDKLLQQLDGMQAFRDEVSRMVFRAFGIKTEE